MLSELTVSPRTGTTYPLDIGGFGSGAGGRQESGGYDVNPYSGAPMANVSGFHYTF
jgi:hypothetical protein